MTQEELKEMERFAAILNSRLEEVTDKYEDIDDRIKDLDEEPVRDICRVIDKIQEEYNELDDKLTDLSEAVEELTEAIRRMKEGGTTMTEKIAPTLTWEENEKGTLIGTATLDDGTVVKYKCINMGDDDNPKWEHLRAMCIINDMRYKGDYDIIVETEIEGREDAQTRMRSIHLCMKDLRELVKTL